MTLRRVAGNVAVVFVVLLVVAMVLGQLLGQPVLLGYVTSDSMSPDLEPGDGFVAIPAVLMDDPEPGDVVVFQARELEGGGLTTHRVVEETENGYITKGDNNPFTDQDADEPPVTDGQVVAYALQVNGDVVAIPGLGTAVSGLQSTIAAPFEGLGADRVGSGLVFTGIALFVLAGLSGGDRRETSRQRDRENVVAVWVVVVFAVVVVTAFATAAMVLPAGVHEFGVISTDRPTGQEQVVRPGATANVSYEVHNGGFLPVLIVNEPASNGVAVEPDRAVVGGGQGEPVNVTIQAPGETGRYLRSVRESRYLLVLPVELLAWLHSLHPLVALVAVDLLVATFVLAMAVAVFGTGRLRLRPTGGSVELSVRVRRRVRRWW